MLHINGSNLSLAPSGRHLDAIIIKAGFKAIEAAAHPLVGPLLQWCQWSPVFAGSKGFVQVDPHPRADLHRSQRDESLDNRVL